MIALDSSSAVSFCGKLVTEQLQALLDQADVFTFKKGTYLISPLYLHSNMKVIFEEGAVLLLTNQEQYFKRENTRIAGIEMMSYLGAISLVGVHNVSIKGHGQILGQGDTWYEKYWGKDMLSGMRKEYDEAGLRWACDYDCLRPKNIVAQNCYDIEISDIELRDSPFWNLHVLYSHDVILDNIVIIADKENAPSTDGIDVDSSYNITIKNCVISTNDDCISIKSGRDLEGLIINRASHDILIENCHFKKGYGLSIGSELSGGIENIIARNLTFDHSDCGFRIKSSKTRKGYVKNIILEHISIHDVKYPFYCYLDWNPLYNKNVLPPDFNKPIPPHYQKLLLLPSKDILDTYVEGLRFEDIQIDYDDKSQGCLLTFKGFFPGGIKNVIFKNMNARVAEYGTMENTSDVSFIDCQIEVTSNNNTVPGSFDNR